MMFNYFFHQVKFFLVLALILIFGVTSAYSQTVNYTKGALNVDVTVSNPCDGVANSGFITFKVNNATGPSASANIQVFGPPSQAAAVTVNVGNSFTFNVAHTLPATTYNIIIVDNNGSDIINSFAGDAPVVLTLLPVISLTPTVSNNLVNSDCTLPLEAVLEVDIGGGSTSLAGGGSFGYTWTSSTVLSGMPKSGTVSGLSPKLNLNTLLGLTGLPGGTYTLSITDKFSSCSNSIVQTIVDPSPQNFTASTSTSVICQGDVGVILLSGSESPSPAPGVVYELYKDGVASGITSGGTGAGLIFNVPAAQLVAPNTYTFQVIASNGVCTPRTMTGSPTITVKPLPVPTLGGSTSVCINSTGNVYTTEAGMSGYVWSIVGGTITSGGTAVSNTATVTWTSSGPQSISVNYTAVNGCTASTATSYAVTVNPLPVPTLGGSNNVCINSTGNVYTTEAGMSGYVWSIVGGTITAGGTGTDNTATVTWTSSGAQSISVNYQDSNGCTASAPTNYAITVNPLPVPTLGGPASVCLSSTGNVYTTEAGMSNYVWSIVGGTITSGGTAASNTATVTWTSSGAQSISVNYQNGNGCTASTATNYPVTVKPLPVPTLGGSNSVCINSTGNVYTTEAGMSGYVWSIVGGTITSGGTAVSNTATVTWTSSGAQSISVNYTAVNGCAASAATSYAVTVNPLPVPTLGGSTSVCINSTGNVYTTEAGMSGYVWSIVGGTITSGGTAASNTATVTWTSSGAQSISVNYQDSNGCTASAPTNYAITVNPLPVPTLGGPASVCLSSTGNVYTTEAGMSNYVWSIIGGTITSGGTAASNTATVTWTSSGAQSISVNYQNGNGCTASTATNYPVTVKPLPVPTLGGSNSVCINSTGNVYTTEAGMSSYVWSIVGGTITAGGTGTDNTATVTWTSSGAQSISVNYTAVNGCAASAPTNYPVTVNPLPVPTLGGSNNVCINSTGNVYTTEAGMSNYVWSIVGGTITSGGTAASNTATVTWTSSGAQSISVNYQDANGCTASAPTNYAITVNPLPVPTLGGPASVCLSSTGNVYTTEAGMSNYVWSIIGGTITSGGTAASNTATVTWTSSGAQSISVNYQNGNGCTASTATNYPVTVKPLPVPTLGGSNSVCINSTGNVYTTEAGMSGYVWSIVGGTITSGGTAVSNTATVTWTSSGAQSISVNYTAVNGCAASAATSYAVTVNPLPVPTLGGSNNVCINSTGNVYTTEAGMSGYVWSIVGGTITSGGTAASNTATVTWTSSGAQSISVNYQDSNGCTASAPTSFAVTVNSINGNPATFGNETWIGYVYDDNSVVVPPTSNINFPVSTYRGFLDNTEIASLGFSNYDIVTDFFDFNTANSVPVAGPNICGSYLNDFSIRFRMNKTFAAGIYTFNLGGDDGVQLKIDGALISLSPANSFNPHSYNLYTSVGVCLTAGIHAVEIEYYERSGFSRVSYSNQLASGPVSVSPITQCINSAIPTLTASSTDPGVTSFKWYTDAALTNLVATTPVATPNYTPLAADLNMSAVGSSDFYVTAVYACGQTTATRVDVSIVSAATINLPTPPIQICKTSGIVDLTTLVTATPAGGTFTFSGTGVTTSPNFDPSLVAGSSNISVVYSSGGCTANASFTIGVIINATITVPAANVTLCQSASIQDLTLLVSATPLGGAFTFSGAGVTGTTFDPSLQTGIVPITVNYNAGGCTDTKTFNYNVVSTATLTVNNSKVVCVSDPDVDLTTLVSASPSGGVFTFSGTGVTGNFFDPSSSPGVTRTINITYVQGGCTTSGTVDIKTGTPATLTIDNTSKVCSTVPDIDLTTLVVASVTGGTFTFTGTDVTANMFDPSNSAGSAVVINVAYALSGCTTTGVVIINVRSATDTACGAVGPPAGGPCSTVVITPAPSPATCNSSDGSISFGINPPIAAGLRIDIIGISTSNLGVSRTNFNNPVLSNLPRGTYNYTIEYGDATCIKTGQVTIGKVGGVADPVATNIIEPLCFGDPSGSVKLDVAGETGNTLQWSLDATNWKNFTAGSQVTGIPSGAAPSFQQTISVRKSASDLCFGGVSITMKGPLSALDTLSTKKVISQPDLATGSLLVDIIESGQLPYEARLELLQPLFTGQVFAQDWTTIARNSLNLKYEINFSGLYAGNYQLSLRDGLGCIKNYSIVIKVDTQISLPNIFTPNGDGVNEVFYIRNLPADSRLVVTNRWGTEVYSSKNYQNDWDGGSTVDGVYYYKLSAAGESFSGWIEILRGK